MILTSPSSICCRLFSNTWVMYSWDICQPLNQHIFPSILVGPHDFPFYPIKCFGLPCCSIIFQTLQGINLVQSFILFIQLIQLPLITSWNDVEPKKTVENHNDSIRSFPTTILPGSLASRFRDGEKDMAAAELKVHKAQGKKVERRLCWWVIWFFFKLICIYIYIHIYINIYLYKHIYIFTYVYMTLFAVFGFNVFLLCVLFSGCLYKGDYPSSYVFKKYVLLCCDGLPMYSWWSKQRRWF